MGRQSSFYHISLKVKITFFFLAIAVLPIIVFQYVSMKRVTEVSMNIVSRELYEKTNIVARLIDHYLADHIRMTKIIANHVLMHDRENEVTRKSIRKIVSENNSISNMYVVDGNAEVVEAADKGNILEAGIEVGGVALKTYLQSHEIRPHETIVSDVMLIDDTPYVFMMAPLSGLSRSLVVQVNLYGIELLVDDFDDELIGDKHVYLLNSSNEVILSQDPDAVKLKLFDDYAYSQVLKEVLGSEKVIEKTEFVVFTDRFGDEVIGGISSTSSFGINEGINWRLIAVAPLKEIAKPASDIEQTLLPVGVGIIVISLLFASMLLMGIIPPLNKIVNFANRLSKKESAQKLDPEEFSAEFFVLAETLNRMLQEIKARSDELTELNKNLESKVEEEIKKRYDQEQMLIQQSKLAGMGEMLGNIAHQWRQPLNALNLVVANIKLAHDRGKIDDVFIRNTMEKSNRLIQKMSSTIEDFSNFFKPDKTKKVFLLHEVVDEALSLLEGVVKHNNIVIEEEDVDKEIYVEGFRNEFSQVVLNIINNAKDVLVDNHIADPVVNIAVKGKDGTAVMVIEDNGGGIPENIMDRVFEPYFTTKEEGKGTGIGLYMSKMIVEENMKGRIFVENGEHGARFIITLPLYDKG